ncbi:MAG: serine/threonine-protein kinase, partial [Gammaproteobacteria bacterium]|nr:serine/threonine-protein kinase [Gammaproteobacteria bacterium]
ADLTEPAISEPTVITTGSVIKDRFVLEEIIGAGGMSIVYKALDRRKQEAKNRNPHVAIKVLGDIFKNHLQSLLVLERESQQIQKLAHPNIVTVYDFDRDRDVIYMTMECLSGKSLDQIISQNKQGMPYEKVVPFVEGMCRGLAYAHSKNIIHSDFKPENVFYTKEKVVKILDFGIARAKQMPDAEKNEEFDAGSLGALTPPYASCEMFENKDPDPRDDIYALGCVTYKLLTGEHPFDGMPSIKAREKKLKPKRLNNLTKRQWKTLEAALAFDREDRIPTVVDFLNGFLPRKISPWVYATAAALILTVSVGGYSWFTVSTQPELPQIKLTEEEEKTITEALETADVYVSMGYLASPPGDSAFDQYEKVLSIDPTNLQAIEGKKKIAEQYLKMAEKEKENKDFEQSLSLIRTGLIVEPDNESLKELEMEVKDLRATNK